MFTNTLPAYSRETAPDIYRKTHQSPPPALQDIACAHLTGYAETGENVGVAGALRISPIVLHQIFAALDSGLGRSRTEVVFTLLTENLVQLENEIPLATFLFSVTEKYPKHFRHNQQAGALVAAGLLYRIRLTLLKEKDLEIVAGIIDEKKAPDFSSSAFRAGKLLTPIVKTANNEQVQAQTLLLVLHQLVIMEENGGITKTFLRHLLHDSLGHDWQRVPEEDGQSDLAEAKQAISKFLKAK